jgi:hypothetical protein
MKKLISISIWLSLQLTSFGQQGKWHSATGWKVYEVPEAKIWQISLDSLPTFKHKALNTDSIQEFLSQTTLISIQYPPAWMGAYVATCWLGQKLTKVIISTYGGFFYDQLADKYYQVPMTIQRDWLNYWAASVASFPTFK